ncbi:hypothetical protein MB02_14145 [Croceicoccus estronivorus]|uniref:sulfotransferase family protein n=1 Tax=Croceicoccus estronivorus TaxID=1172626 RepID=UPI0008362A2C|nr:sulfotransferase [Croceicoccus estronivorus]OCC22906.1 hypothetical protein MB02_14145 [Croceicoccus estronivorus]
MNGNVQPIFLIGAPRSGTTVCFDMFSTHPQAAIATNHDDLLSATPLFGLIAAAFTRPENRFSLGKHGPETGPGRFTNLAPRKTELFRFWNRTAGERFVRGYLWDTVPEEAEATRIRGRLLRIASLQRRSHLVLKLTGPGRIRYLKALFPDARFIHLTRTAEAQVASLLKTSFWNTGKGRERLWWHRDIPAQWAGFLADAEATGSPPALAAAQWSAVVNSIRTEAEAILTPETYIEIGYSDFVNAPVPTVQRLWKFAGLDAGQDATARLKDFTIRKDNDEKWKSAFTPGDLAQLQDWIRIERPVAT